MNDGVSVSVSYLYGSCYGERQVVVESGNCLLAQITSAGQSDLRREDDVLWHFVCFVVSICGGFLRI